MKEPTSPGQVLATPEVLEAILLHLPIKDLLVNAQRINHAWKILINTSPLLQQALFFKPQSFPSPKPRLNPLLQQSFPIFFDGPVEASKEETTSKQKAYSRADASWRRMLPIQPAIRTLAVVRVTYAQGGDGKCSGKRVFQHGVRMGTLWDLVENEVVSPITRFRIKWAPENRYEDGLGLLGWEREASEADGKAIVTLEWTMQCCVDMDDSLGDEFRSAGYEEVKIDFGEEKWSEH